MLRATVICFGLLTTAACAQTVMDGSDKPLGANVMLQVQRLLMLSTPDPYGAQLIRLHLAKDDPDSICGYVNLKNQTGGYTGFQPFIVYGSELLLQDAEKCR